MGGGGAKVGVAGCCDVTAAGGAGAEGVSSRAGALTTGTSVGASVVRRGLVLGSSNPPTLVLASVDNSFPPAGVALRAGLALFAASSSTACFRSAMAPRIATFHSSRTMRRRAGEDTSSTSGRSPALSPEPAAEASIGSVGSSKRSNRISCCCSSLSVWYLRCTAEAASFARVTSDDDFGLLLLLS